MVVPLQRCADVDGRQLDHLVIRKEETVKRHCFQHVGGVDVRHNIDMDLTP